MKSGLKRTLLGVSAALACLSLTVSGASAQEQTKPQIQPRQLPAPQVTPQRIPQVGPRQPLQIQPGEAEPPLELSAPVEVSERESAAADDRFRKLVEAGVRDILENREDTETLITDRDLERLQRGLAGDFEAYLDEVSEEMRVRNAEAPAPLDPIVFAVADLGSNALASRDEADIRRSLSERLGEFDDAPGELRELLSKGAPAKDLYGALDKALEEEGGGDAVSGGGRAESSSVSSLLCTGETGAGTGSDSGGGACTPKPNGLMAKWWFPMKPHLGCVRNQANRGTCAAFAMTANAEMRASQMRAKKYNFSEQFSYHISEIRTGRQRWREGMVTQDVITEWTSRGTSLAPESQWPYNPSRNMGSLNKRGTATWQDDIYNNACSGYSGYCTSRAFQGGQNGNATTFYHPSAIIFSAVNIRAANHSKYTWGAFRSREKVLTSDVVNALKTRPVVVGVSVTDKLMNAWGSSYIVWSSSDKNAGGGHAMLIVGYVPKGSLHSGAPKPEGSGFFIVRNSWSTGYGDCGYIYLDEKYVRKQMTSLTSFSVK